MTIEKFEKKLYSEEFIDYLQMFKEDNWKNAKRSKKIEFFEKLYNLFLEVDETLPKKFESCDFEALEIKGQCFCMTDEAFLIDPRFFNKESSPYSLFYMLIFEVALLKRYNSNYENMETNEEEKRMYINTTMSYFDDWCNLYNRTDKEYYYQPITFYSGNDAEKVAYRLLKYMYKTYGMDNALGNYMSALMLKEFDHKEEERRVEENYKVMEDRFNTLIPKEREMNEKIIDWLEENISKLDQLDDQEFFGMLNNKFLFCCIETDKYYICKEFFKRTLKGWDGLDELMKNFCLADSEMGRGIYIDGKMYFCEWDNYPTTLLTVALEYKYKHNLFFEIDDEEFIKEALECNKYFNGVGENIEYYEYADNAYAVNELSSKVFDYYHNLIVDGIRNSKLLNYGYPLISKNIFSKKETFLKYAYGKNYEEVRKEQFDSLKKEYEAKNGVKR